MKNTKVARYSTRKLAQLSPDAQKAPATISDELGELKIRVFSILLVVVGLIVALTAYFYSAPFQGSAYASQSSLGKSDQAVAVVVNKQSSEDVEKALQEGKESKDGNIANPTNAEANVVIHDSNVPLSTLDPLSGRWAMANLILTILSAVIAVIMLINFIIRRSQRIIPVVFGVFTTIAIWVLFLLSQDMGMPMQMFDGYTFAFTAALALVLVSALVQLRRPRQERTTQSQL